jgi:3-hydroxyacyl-CoA dehydrogenase/enoyl-CoA hydratase/3-hydroxybutyryl-CoA epimerase
MAIKIEAVEAQQGFSYRVENGVAVIIIDQPGEPVNTLSPEVGVEFGRLLDRAAEDAAVKAIVFTSAKKDNFVAGAKIDLFKTIKTAEEAEAFSRQGQQGFDRLEGFKKPVVVAINGSCLGGGMEWALACHYRIASDDPRTVLGQPEVQLGIIPGAGATQRLPRLIGAQAALDLILTGKTVRPQKARKLGLVDEVVPRPILESVAKQRALELASGKLTPERGRRLEGAKGVGGLLKGLAQKELWKELMLEDNPVGRKILFDQALKALRKKTRGHYPAPEKALEAVRSGLEHGGEAGLRTEARLFGELVVSDTSHRLVELFFATTQLKKDTGTSDPKIRPRRVKKVGVLGGGLMGGGIAYVTAANVGIPVRIKEKDDPSAGRALKSVRSSLDERVARRALSWREAEARMALVTTSTDLTGFGNADLVIEAVFEDLKLKQQVLRDVEAIAKEECIFASNTSSLPISQIAKASKRPQNVIGMHYFSPVPRMPLLEIIRQPQTADWVTATCVEVGKKQGKTVIVVNDGVGFYTSRVLGPYMNEAAHLLAEGAEIAELDKALVNFGFPVGPVTLLDEVGIDVAAKVAEILHHAFGERLGTPDLLEKFVEQGRLGRKSKKGFYTYDDKKKRVDHSVYAFIPYGPHRKSFDAEEMAQRCALQLVNEAARCLEEKVLRSPRDGDVGAIFGLGFPAYLGGPFRYADSLGLSKVVAHLEHWQDKLGDRFEPSPLLLDLAKQGRKFYPD